MYRFIGSLTVLFLFAMSIQTFTAVSAYKTAQEQMSQAVSLSTYNDHTLLVFDGLEPSGGAADTETAQK